MALRGGFKDDPVQAQALRRLDIGRDIVNVQGLFGADPASPQGLLVDERIRLAGAHAAGIDALRKVPQNRELGFEVRHVQWVGIGKDGEKKATGEPWKELVGEDRF